MSGRRIPRLCHHRSSGQAYVTDPADGQQKYMGVWGLPATEAAYRKWAAAFLARPDPKAAAPKAGCTLAAVALAYLPEARRLYRKRGGPTSTVKKLKDALRHAADCGLASLPAGELTPRHLKGLARQLAAKGLAASTIEAYLSRLKVMIQWAAEREPPLVPEEVADRLAAARGLGRKAGGKLRPPVPPPPAGAVEKALPHLPRPAAAIVRLMRATGMRPGEACGLRASDVDDSQTPWLARVHEDWNKEAHKGKSRDVYLGPQAREALVPWLAAARRAGPDAPLFPCRVRRVKGRQAVGHYTAKTLNALVGAACGAAGCPHWAPNQIRHEHGARVRKAMGADAAQAALGHHKMATTELYAPADPGLAREVAERLG